MCPRQGRFSRESSPGSMAPRQRRSRVTAARCCSAKCSEVPGNGSIYLRKTDGSDAIRLGDGFGEDLSPDGKWVLATPVGTRQHWIIMPTGPGSAITLPPGPLVARGEANFLPNGRQIVFGGREKDRGGRIYVQDIDGGSIRAISPENVGTQGLATPDSRYVVGRTTEHVFKFAVDGSAPIPLTYLDPDDEPLQWSPDGSLLFVTAGRCVAGGGGPGEHGYGRPRSRGKRFSQRTWLA